MITLLFGALQANAADLALPMPSPSASVMQKVGVADLTVSYSSPGKKGREIWGGVVPYGELWRTGANAATTFETSQDLTVAGKPVPAGKYAIFTIPGKDEWTFILNKDWDASTDEYAEKENVLSVKLAPGKGPERERMTFLFTDTTDDGTRLDLEWDGVRLSVPIAVATGAIVNASIDAYLDDAMGDLARAARFQMESGNLDRALVLIDRSLAVKETWFNVWMKADILHRKDQHKQAYALAQRAMELGKAAGEDFFYKARVEKALSEWRKK